MKIYIGWDPREQIAYDVAEDSIRRHTPEDPEIIKLSLDSVKDIFKRPIEVKDGKLWCPISQAPMATEFAISRFCVPFLTEGWALFMDSDMVVLDNLRKLFHLRDDKYAVMVVKHAQEGGPAVKMDGQVQTYYSRKNWSSVMLFNCNHPANKNLTLEMLNTVPGRDLHAFCWLKDEEIGALPPEWNHLVDVNPPRDNIKIAHYTLGGPWFKDWKNRPSDDIWNEAVKHLKK